MPSTTPRLAIPYPLQSEAKDQVLGFNNMSAVADDKYVLRFATASARNAAIPSPVEGMLAYLSVDDIYTLYNGSAWIRLEQAKFYAQPSTTLPANGTAAALSALAFTGVANAVYQYDIQHIYSSTTVNVNWIRIGWSVPAGTTVQRFFGCQSEFTNNRAAALMNWLGYDGDPTALRQLGGSFSGAGVEGIEKGIIRMGSTSGTVVPTAAKASTAADAVSTPWMNVRRIS